VLGKGDGDVLAPDARPHLVVRLVPRAVEQLAHPTDQGVPQVADLALAALERLAGAFVGEDAIVEEDRDSLEVRLGDGMQRAQGVGIRGAEADVAFQLFEDRLFHSAGARY
jgi:hypothetical protein